MSSSASSVTWDTSSGLQWAFLGIGIGYFCTFLYSSYALYILHHIYIKATRKTMSRSSHVFYPAVIDAVSAFKRRLFLTAGPVSLSRAIQMPFAFWAPFQNHTYMLMYLYANSFVTLGFFALFFIIVLYFVELAFVESSEHWLIKIATPKSLFWFCLGAFTVCTAVFLVSLGATLSFYWIFLVEVTFFAVSGLAMAVFICLSGRKLILQVNSFARQAHVRKLIFMSSFSTSAFAMRSIAECCYFFMFSSELSERSESSKIALLLFYALFEFFPTIIILRFLRPRRLSSIPMSRHQSAANLDHQHHEHERITSKTSLVQNSSPQVAYTSTV
eukprot:ANDGO_02918.mRNA.1 hypothetical protein